MRTHGWKPPSNRGIKVESEVPWRLSADSVAVRGARRNLRQAVV
jgi:hypothetical protein